MRHAKMIARALRTLADTIEMQGNPRTFRTVYAALDRVRTLVNLALYSYQKKLIQNTAYDFDPSEVRELLR